MLSMLRYLRTIFFIGGAAMVGYAASEPADAGQLFAMGENFYTGPKFGIIDPVSGSFTQFGSGTFADCYVG